MQQTYLIWHSAILPHPFAIDGIGLAIFDDVEVIVADDFAITCLLVCCRWISDAVYFGCREREQAHSHEHRHYQFEWFHKKPSSQVFWKEGADEAVVYQGSRLPTSGNNHVVRALFRIVREHPSFAWLTYFLRSWFWYFGLVRDVYLVFCLFIEVKEVKGVSELCSLWEVKGQHLWTLGYGDVVFKLPELSSFNSFNFINFFNFNYFNYFMYFLPFWM